MARFRNLATDVVVSVADEKDDRFADGWEIVPAEKPVKKQAGKSASK